MNTDDNPGISLMKAVLLEEKWPKEVGLFDLKVAARLKHNSKSTSQPVTFRVKLNANCNKTPV